MTNRKVLIVEDEPIIAENIKALLQQVNYTVVGIAFTKNQALELLKNTSPTIALLDINLGNNLHGIEIAEHINTHYNIPFLYLTSYSSKLILDKVKHTFPMGYIVKPFDEADLFTGIEIALSNYNSIKKSIVISLETINKNSDLQLTKKEFIVLQEMYSGLSNLQISEKHFVSPNTVKTHVQNIYSKLNVHNRADAIVAIRKILNR